MKVIRGDGDGAGIRLAIVAARFHESITTALVEGAAAAARRAGVADDDLTVVWVPGAFEIPTVAEQLAAGGAVDAVICLGAVIRGETAHFELVANEAAHGVAEVARGTGVPCIFEVLATEDLDQARSRAGGDHGNKGWEAVTAAIEMVHLVRALPESVAHR